MSCYADANLLIRYFLNLDDGVSRELLTDPEVMAAWPLPVTDVLRLEVRNGIERMVYDGQHMGGQRVSRGVADAAHAAFDEELRLGNLLVRNPLTLREVEGEFDTLALRHTARHGFRTYDILHVASALTLQCGRFYSFDRKAVELAKLEGIPTNLIP
ncbi:MAG TPA: hypothetical protein DDZ88_24945 [Verrucomicrobiales bacterium]|nr:hypothetical protein [Verrucomicrobiales bacterium]